MKIQHIQPKIFLVLTVVILIAIGIIIGIRSTVFGGDRKSITKEALTEVFSDDDPQRILNELSTLQEDERALQNDSVIMVVATFYDKIDQYPFSGEEKNLIKEQVIHVFFKSKTPFAMKSLKNIALVESNPIIKESAYKTLMRKKRLTISEQIDTSRYISIDGEGMSYEKAYPILVSWFQSPSIDKKIRAAALLSRFGALIKDKPIIDELINTFISMPDASKKQYKDYSDQEKENLSLKFEILQALAASGNEKGKRLVAQVKGSSNPYLRDWADKVELWSTKSGGISPGFQPINPIKNNVKDRGRYYILGKHVTQKDALTLIESTYQQDNSQKIQAITKDIARDPSIIQNTHAFEILSNFLLRITDKDRPTKWTLSSDELTFVKNQTFSNIINSSDSRIKDFIVKAKESKSSELKELANQYEKDEANE